MACSAQRLGFFARSVHPFRATSHVQQDVSIPTSRCFSTTPTRFAIRQRRRDAAQDDTDAQFEKLKAEFGDDIPTPQEAIRELLKNADPEDLKGYVEKRSGRMERGFWNLGEPKMGPNEVWQGDDIPTKAHRELEQMREIRHYARLTTWELPLLSKLAKPFEPPTNAMPLRFRYTTYMGELHPASRKVVAEFCVSDMPGLTRPQKDKLIKLAGARYNPSTDIIKMSCENYETQTQNKRYLGDLINTLLKEAKDDTDTFADVPFDFRHHKPKVFHNFPEEWLLTPKRQQMLARQRQERLLSDQRRAANGTLIDGKAIVEKSFIAGVPAAASGSIDMASRVKRPRMRTNLAAR